MKKSKWFCALLVGIMTAASLSFATFSSAADAEEYVLISGDSTETNTVQILGPDAWASPSDTYYDKTDKKEGESALASSPHPGSARVEFKSTFASPIDISADAEKWALEMWLYVDDIDKIRTGSTSKSWVVLSSSTEGDPDGVRWDLKKFITAGMIKSGWNKLVLYVRGAEHGVIKDAFVVNTEHGKLDSLKTLRIFLNNKGGMTDLMIKVDDVKLTKNPTKRSDGYLLDGTSYNPDTNFTQGTVPTDADLLKEKTPDGGPCLSYATTGSNGIAGCWPYYVPKTGMFDLGDVSNKALEALIYINEELSEDDILEKYKECRIDISSSGDSETDSYKFWLLGVKDDQDVVNLKPGWSTVTIPFTSNYAEKLGTPDTANINYLRPYFVSNSNTELQFKIGYIKVVDIPRETTTITSDSEDVSIENGKIVISKALTVEDFINALVLEDKTVVKLYDKNGAEIDITSQKAESAEIIAKLVAFDADTNAKLSELAVEADIADDKTDDKDPDSSNGSSDETPKTGTFASVIPFIALIGAAALVLISKKHKSAVK